MTGFHSSLHGNCTIDDAGTVRDESGQVVAADGVIGGTTGLRGDMTGYCRQEVTQQGPPPGGCYWPIDDAATADHPAGS